MLKGRNQSVDAFRLLAIFGVVMIHMAPSTNAAEAMTGFFSMFAVPFFLLISLHFFIARASSLGLRDLLALRPDRILVPCAVWTVLYTLMRLLKCRLLGESLELDLIGLVFFGAGGVQLYFLPLLLLFQAQALSLILLLRGGTSSLLGVAVGAAAAAFGYSGDVGSHFGFHGALGNGIVYGTLAFLLGRMQAATIGRRINIAFGIFTGAFLVSTAALGRTPFGLPMMQSPLIGYGISACALNWRFHSTRPAFSALLTCSYGIFLAHFGFLETVEFFADRLGFVITPYSVCAKLGFAALICAGCVSLIGLLRKQRLLAYLFLGECRNPLSTCVPAHESPEARVPA